MKKTSIIITSYLESTKKYLDECVRSVKNLSYDGETETIIVAPKAYAEKISYAGVKIVSPAETSYHNPVGINTGVRASDPNSDFIFLLNDDLVLTKNSLKNMVAACGDSPVIVNPVSPCGLRSTYYLHIGFKKNNDWVMMQKPQFRYEEIKDYFDFMMNSDSMYPSGLISQPWLAMFATLIPRKVWNTVGEFDEGFKTSQDDLDYSWRAAEKGCGLLLALDSLVFHFSGVSADSTMKLKNRLASAEYFKEKWKQLPPGMTEELLNSWREKIKSEG